MRKVIVWGENSAYVHDFAGISGLSMDNAREVSIDQHVKSFGRDLKAMLR